MQIAASILMTALLIVSVSFSIQGDWTLQDRSTISKGRFPIVLSISDFIFKEQEILQKLSFK